MLPALASCDIGSAYRVDRKESGVRQLDAAQRQIDAFLRPDGRIEQFCDGPCDPE